MTETSPKFAYRLLPRGNAGDFSWIDEELRKRDVAAEISSLHAGGRLYRIPVAELHKLPVENGEPYLGTEYSGWSLSYCDSWERDRASDFAGEDWRAL